MLLMSLRYFATVLVETLNNVSIKDHNRSTNLTNDVCDCIRFMLWLDDGVHRVVPRLSLENEFTLHVIKSD